MKVQSTCHPAARCAASTSSLALFSILAGILATFALGYHYGLNNHIELLPPILRILDPGYCPGDFAVDATAGYGHRFFFSHLCAWLAKGFPLPAVLLLLTLVQNIGIALVTGFAARDLHGRETWAPWVAVALVLSLDSIQLGDADFLRQPYSVPVSLILPVALFALWQGIRLRPFTAMALAMPSVLMHPLVGMKIGGVALAICGLSALLDRDRPPPVRRRMAGRAGWALAGLVLFTALAWGPAQSRDLLDTQQFLDIYARLRAPHHLLPSTFRPIDYVAALCFLAAAGLSWREWRRSSPANDPWNRGLLLGTGLSLALLFCGWFFVEVIPTRFWAMLQTFRMITVLKWFGLLLFAGTIGRAWSSKEPGAAATGTLLFLPVGYAQPFAALWAHGVELVRRRIPASQVRWAIPALMAIGFMGLVLFLWAGPSLKALQVSREAFSLLGITLLMALFRGVRRRALRDGLALLFVAAVVGLLAANRSHRLPVGGGFLRQSTPIFTLADAQDPADRVAGYCRDKLPPDSLVLTPPNLGRFRLVAERSIVVDFKFAMPNGPAWIEWHRRMTNCYGTVEARGFGAAWQMDQQYGRISDPHLERLVATYGITHAVLHARTPTRFPVRYEDETFKLVQLPGRQPHQREK